jgi:hypothetical protein
MKKMRKFSGLIFLVLLSALEAAIPGMAVAAPSSEGYYTVTAEILPILKTPGTKYKMETDEVGRNYIEYSDDIEGVVVFGNKVKLRPKGKVFELLSPEDENEVLGFVPAEGVTPFPADCESAEVSYYMTAKDAPKLSLTPDGNEDLPNQNYFLLQGEVVPSYGTRGEKILLSFGTQYGDSGVGGRFAWADARDFIALASYRPDNTKADPKLIPATRRLFGGIDPESLEKLPKSLTASLSKRGFMIDETPLLPKYEHVNVDDMADLYTRTAYYEADFITTDIFLHAFHLLFDQSLQKFERTFLTPRLKNGLNAAIETLASHKSAFTGESKKAYEKAYDLFSVAAALLEDDPTEAELSDAGLEEVERVLAAETLEKSPVTGQTFDYTLSKPRGHYTISEKLERYFRAMNYIGLAELPLFEPDGKPMPENVQAAAAVSLALDANRKEWERFEDPMTFLVGVPNAGDPKLYRELVRKRLGSGSEAWKKLGDEKLIVALAEDIAEKMPGPKIQSVMGIDKEDSEFDKRAAVFRISPRRFTWDAYILNQLTSLRVGTDDAPRNMPRGTDVMAVFGSSVADALSKGNFDIKNYEKNLTELKKEAPGAVRKEKTVYASWLSAFLAGFEDSGSGQFFYRNEGWGWKRLATNLASWAELKHDTILYAEQGGAEGGEGGDWFTGPFEAPAPRGYVEPDPQFFDAMLDANNKLLAFIERYGVEEDDEDGERKYSKRLEQFGELIETARAVARKEIDDKALSPEEYESIKQIARGFDEYLMLPDQGLPWDNDELRERAIELRKMACVADVHTNGFDKTVLEAAVGVPRAIYVFANDRAGGARVTRGYVFSYYEFEKPMTERMTDEEWRAMVYDPSRAEELESLRPDWHEEFLKNTR